MPIREERARRNMLSVPCSIELARFLKEEAHREERSLAQQARYLLLRAMEARQGRKPDRKAAAA
jgi:hypothetical protein